VPNVDVGGKPASGSAVVLLTPLATIQQNPTLNGYSHTLMCHRTFIISDITSARKNPTSNLSLMMFYVTRP